MKNGRRVFIALLTGTFLLGMTGAFAWANEGTRCERDRGHVMPMSRHGLHAHGAMSGHLLRHLLRHKHELGLTDDQIVKLRTLSLEQDRARIRAHADMLVAKRELQALVWDDGSELPAIEAKINESEALEATLTFMGIKGRRDLKAVLTPEQRAKLKTLWEQRRHRAGTRMMRAETELPGEPEELTEGTAGVTEIEIGELGEGRPLS